MRSQPIYRARRWLKGFMLRRTPGMITCREFDDFIVDYLEGMLPSGQRRLFERHMRMCGECRQYMQAYQRMIEAEKAVFTSSETALPSSVPEGVVTAILEAREQAGPGDRDEG